MVLVPCVGQRPPAERPELVQRLIRAPERLVIGSALLAGTTGLALGVSSGRIRGVDDAFTPFGMLWVASIAVAVGVFATGGLVTSRAAAQLHDRARSGPGRRLGAGGERRLAGSGLGFGVELAGIITILALMVALGRA